ncbi:pilus (MSHA type) biogenesis protein MshL [Idiomarina xiamenensis]|uniref:Type II secretory pathway n=1 Tax=Idiomarina xiamenensis 10-D-4 TaxID=740709 RepID=K2KC22_9GAMM|nr:pilus (MSHA type) biogenesis protein MshL [Idiomarina xiamenensis]EKE85408.1 Type II secretory pathway [Idiomarina xiamenensis 10-D-4]
MMMKRLALWPVLALVACTQVPERQPKEAQRMLNEAAATAQTNAQQKPVLPNSVQSQLQLDAGGLSKDAAVMLAEPRFNVQAKDVSANAFFNSLVADTDYNIAVHPKVDGSISLSLKDVTLDETLAVVADIYGYEIRRNGRMVRIFPAGMRTETMTLDYLALQRLGISQMQVSAGGVRDEERNGYGNNRNNNSSVSQNRNNNNFSNPMLGGDNGSQSNQVGNSLQGNGSSIASQSETNLWQQLQETLEGIVGSGSGSRVVVSPQAGLISVTAYPEQLRAVREFLSTAERRLQRQVILETRVIEVTLNDEYQQGINWAQAIRNNTTVSFTGDTTGNSISSAIGGVFGITFQDQNFAGVINLLQTQGNVQVLSNPRVSAANNQKAVIKIGDDEYFVTDVSTTTVTGTATTTSPNIELTPFFSGIALDVTPQISDNGDVVLHVHPTVVETTEQEKVVRLNNDEFVLPLAQSNIRESDTIIRARNGEVVVIGGLMQNNVTERKSKVPLLGDIPGIGELFTNRQQIEQKKELIILLRPVVVGADTWRQQIERSSDILKRWYPDN